MPHRSADRRLTRPEAEKLDNRADVRVAQLAAREWGVLSVDELHGCGLSDDAIAVRVRNGRLHPMHRGVYAVVNVPLVLAGRRVVPDFRWPAERLVVEADGAAWHGHRLAREDDAERQALLEAHGERVVRVTWHQAVSRRADTLKRFRAAGAPGHPGDCRLTRPQAEEVDNGRPGRALG